MEKNYACYICKGCGIGDAFNLEALAEAIGEEGVSECKEVDVLCSPEGVELLKADAAAGVNAMVLGACSGRVKTDEFDIPGVLIERVSLREQALYCSEPEYESEVEAGEDRQMLAEDYLRMAGSKIGKAEIPTPYKLEADPATAIMVVGGGIAGLTAAKQLADAGETVYLVEKEAALGGFMGKMAKLAPETPPYRDLEETGLEALVAELEASDKVTIYTGTEVTETKGAPGQLRRDPVRRPDLPGGRHHPGHRLAPL